MLSLERALRSVKLKKEGMGEGKGEGLSKSDGRGEKGCYSGWMVWSLLVVGRNLTLASEWEA